MEFEFDEKKSQINRAKHGINFVDAKMLWLDGNRIEIPAKTEDEVRILIVGKITGKHWSAIVTYRGENIRIISCRRSRKEEVELYES